MLNEFLNRITTRVTLNSYVFLAHFEPKMSCYAVLFTRSIILVKNFLSRQKNICLDP